MFGSNSRDTLGCSLPTPRKTLVAFICTLSIESNCLEQPHTSALYNKTKSTSSSSSFINMSPLRSPTVTLHLLIVKNLCADPCKLYRQDARLPVQNAYLERSCCSKKHAYVHMVYIMCTMPSDVHQYTIRM